MKLGYMRRFSILLVFLILSSASSGLAENAGKWSFAVFSDNRNFEIAYRNVLQNMNAGGPKDPGFPKPDFVVGVGDIDPVRRTFQIFRDAMGPQTTFIPVRGNHEAPEDVRFILQDILPSEKPPVTVYDKESATFFYDWKNVRLIVIDEYTRYAKNLGDPEFLKWLEEAVVSAKHADHVFISFHEPHFPADIHSDPFWGMLLKHTGKVRAVFWGHSHIYARRYLPDSYGGIELINAGAAGNTGHFDGMNTYVEVAVDGKHVSFRAVQAPDKTRDFRVTDSWKAKAN
ncbi:conserved exported hypothetical protein [Syntrophobacter sp. SbD1]|nr:conserved exported hypothetical protein [Syntrophobacter sp. SbD1]